LYLAEEMSEAKAADVFWREDRTSLSGTDGHLKRQAFLKKLARLLRSLHRQKIYHNDLQASNILVVDRAATGEVFSLIDLQGLRRCFHLSWRRRIKNLAQLNRTLGVFLTQSERLLFLDAYMGCSLRNSPARNELVKKILRQSRRQLEKRRHRPRVFSESD
jgi:tRNA A-37 threonylcarbamoyl transferase component Bud32